MGCTHSKNSKSKSTKVEHPLERSRNHPNRIAHFDETQKTSQSTSDDPEEGQVKHYSKTLLNQETNGDSTYQNPKANAHLVQEKSTKSKDGNPQATTAARVDEHLKPAQTQQSNPQAPELPIAKIGSDPQTAIPPTYQQKHYAASTYYPMPVAGEKHKSPEKKKQLKKVDNSDEKKKEPPRDKAAAVGPNYRLQLTPDDLEYIRRSVQQRNERRAYMMAHRNETDDTLYELEVRMPEKDYTNRIETATQNNSRVY